MANRIHLSLLQNGEEWNNKVDLDPNFKADLSDADLCGQDFSYRNFTGANLANVNFNKCNLTGANFDKANLVRAKFKGAKLLSTYFTEANLSSADFSPYEETIGNIVEPIKTDFSLANFTDAITDKANFTDVRFFKTTMPDRSLHTSH
ncbi:pentapeptide repeat-containing protein [Nostoc sp. NMS9]|uniref:pentapeptide repeat-containing protein n=1 Tax=Nostoc sp. NMS9 TaxID=2815393 RepID=UPI0025CD444D|nr:pentapeptide repeat-containing protein [Nostoc sp. NMS9]MBN3942409.1 pentapeptide repeat-containing protein [Nostoc sp. NMS9]